MVKRRKAADGGKAEAKSVDYFDSWQTRYHDFYPENSRLDLEYRTSRMLVLAGRGWVNRIDNILRAETGQTRARWQVLFALGFAEQPVTLSEICRRVRVQWPTMVRVIEGMVNDGLILREDNPGDGRSKLARLTPRGMEVMEQIQPILDRERSRILSRLSVAELKLCAGLLNRIFEDAIAD